MALARGRADASSSSLLSRARAAFSSRRVESLVFDVGKWISAWERVRGVVGGWFVWSCFGGLGFVCFGTGSRGFTVRDAGAEDCNGHAAEQCE